MRIVHVIGNRPQFIKLAVLLKALDHGNCKNTILHTGQHFDDNMSKIFFAELAIPDPNYLLGINSLPHSQLIGQMLLGVDAVLEKEVPDCVLVYGDTNTTLAGALAAKKRNIPVIHVEAGIRTGNEEMPEEANRYLADRISSLNFCSTYLCAENLKKEGFESQAIDSRVVNSGDLLLDACKTYGAQALNRGFQRQHINANQNSVLATIHRAENIDNKEKLRNIIQALNVIHENTPVIFPMHPKTNRVIRHLGLEVRFHAIEAVGYLDNLSLIQQCSSVITDSGGLSREAFFFNKPVLVLMEYPFWPEIFVHGNGLRSASVAVEIVQSHQRLLGQSIQNKVDIFGDGHAAEKIATEILKLS
ncbi:MAG: UDP-N-acetylglucosamine 2-epimerase (non-hydrolyzing) [Bacteroidetes bacterium]|nr:MAG: UDP-N-acetylglucosamine 2-epimerase (non-hydrolyzing) [Bacteroidota bacterium]